MTAARNPWGKGWMAAPVSVIGWIALGLIALGTLSGCGSSVTVKASYDPRANFSHYRTFAMAEPNKAMRTQPGADPFVHQRLRQLIFENLSARGFVAAPKEQADLIVYVVTGSHDRVDVYYDRYYGGGYYGPAGYPGGGWGPGTTNTVVVEEMLVVIDLVDRTQNAVLWRGTGNLGSGQDVSDELFRKAVSQILGLYPPGPA